HIDVFGEHFASETGRCWSYPGYFFRPAVASSNVGFRTADTYGYKDGLKQNGAHAGTGAANFSRYGVRMARGSSMPSSPKAPISLPIPDCLKPPKGARGSCGAPLMTTRPAISLAAMCSARLRSDPST